MKNKKLLIAAGCVLGGIAAAAGIMAALAGSGQKPVYVYPYDIAGMGGGYWGDSQQTYGPVRSDNIQTVMLTDTQTVTAIHVKEGDTVKKGDVLMVFDSTLSELALEKKRLAVEQLKLQLQQEKERLQEINNLQPYTPVKPNYTWVPSTGVDGFGAGEVFIPNSGTDPATWKGRLGTSQEDAVILWMKNGNTVNGDIIQAVADFLERARQYWNDQNYDRLYEEYEKALEDWRAEGEDPDQEPQPPQKQQADNIRDFYLILKQVPGDNTASKATVYFGMHAMQNSGEWTFVPFDASAISDYTKTGSEGYSISSGGDDEDTGAVYTLEEIVKMRENQQKTILDVEYKIKVAEAEYSIAQRETKDGSVRSEVDGKVVSVLTPEEAKEKNQPVIKVSGGGGYYVVGTISELERDKLAIGSEVTITDHRTGNMCTGTVESIGDYPSQSGGYSSGSGNSSYYPFNVFVDESADLVGGNYVSISYELEESGSGVYLGNAFVRKIDGQNYVFVQGADGKLEKRAVATGKSLWGSYKEILSGITTEDMIAFPYGKNVKEGAQTQAGDYSTLYGE